MGFGNSSYQNKEESTSLTFNYLILDTLQKMRDSQAIGDYDKFFIYTLWGLQLTMESLDAPVKQMIELDIRKLREESDKIDASKDNEASKVNKLKTLKRSFAESKSFYVAKALPKMDIYRVIKSGVVDFENNDLETITSAIRSSTSNPGMMKRIEKKLDKMKEDIDGI